MGRRIGTVVLVAALVLVAVPALRPDPVIGAPSAAPVAGPPVAGDCVSEPVQRYPGYGGGTGQTYVYPQLAVAPCGGPRYAEVVTVLTDPEQPTLVVEGSSLNVSDPNQDRCRSAAAGYLGPVTVADASGTAWTVVTTAEVSLTRPSPLQEAAGQRWLGCLVGARGSTYPEHDPVPYEGTLADAVRTGVQRDRTGACATATDLQTSYPEAGCARSHTVQLLATSAGIAAGTPRAEIDTRCGQVAATLTRMPDPTADGALAVLTTVTVDGRVIPPAPDGVLPTNGRVACGMTTVGDRTLDGGLVGLGDRPVPWS